MMVFNVKMDDWLDVLRVLLIRIGDYVFGL